MVEDRRARIQTDKQLLANQPHIVVVDKGRRRVVLLDVVIMA